VSAAANASLVNELRETFPANLAIRVVGIWGGVIDYSLDTLPAIARSAYRPGLIYAVGFCGHGIALSVASGAWVTQILCDGAAPDDLPWFRARPPLLPLELARWAGFRAAVSLFRFQDRRL
jgi:glycine/D-amino acid oxidase-like deaminating enzyme